MIEETIFIDADQFFDSLAQAFTLAQKTIIFEMYIFETGPLGIKLLELLSKASARGVQIRLLLDGVGCSEWTYHEAERWRQKGINLKFFHPLPWQKHPRKIWESLSLKKIALGFFKLKHRNHRKICIIDQETLFIGGMNVCKQNLAWRDTSARIKGADLALYLESCKQTWNFAGNFYGMRWLAISKLKRESYDRLLLRLREAKTQIWITNPYFIPDLRLLRTICKIAKSGVDVRLLLPGYSDVFGLKFAIEGLYTLLLTFGVKIYEYTPTTLHAKILIIDDWVCIGSSNLDHRSIFDNFESDAIITLPESQKVVRDQFLRDVSVSTPVELEKWKTRSFHYRFLERFFLLFRNIL